MIDLCKIIHALHAENRSKLIIRYVPSCARCRTYRGCLLELDTPAVAMVTHCEKTLGDPQVLMKTSPKSTNTAMIAATNSTLSGFLGQVFVCRS